MAVTLGVCPPRLDPHLKIAAKERLLAPCPRLGRTWRTMVTSRRSDRNQLREHGLYGWQLAFKLAVIQFFYGRYLLIGKGILNARHHR
jgi:hypothetical protein